MPHQALIGQFGDFCVGIIHLAHVLKSKNMGITRGIFFGQAARLGEFSNHFVDDPSRGSCRFTHHGSWHIKSKGTHGQQGQKKGKNKNSGIENLPTKSRESERGMVMPKKDAVGFKNQTVNRILVSTK